MSPIKSSTSSLLAAAALAGVVAATGCAQPTRNVVFEEANAEQAMQKMQAAAEQMAQSPSAASAQVMGAVAHHDNFLGRKACGIAKGQ